LKLRGDPSTPGEGVQLIRTFSSEHEGARLDAALARLFPEYSRNFLARLIDEGGVHIDAALAVRHSQRVRSGQQVEVNVPPATPSEVVSQDLPLTVLYEDADLVVIDKPAGLVVHPAAGHADRTLVNALLFHVKDLSGIGGELRPGIVHRLDKDTSGVMVIAKNDAVHRTLAAAWGTDRVKKEYLAIVYGKPKKERGTIEAPIGRDPRNRKRMAVVKSGRAALTDYRVVESLRYVSLLRCILRSGRTHQIRVHLKHLGHPIIGDALYSGPQWRGIPDKRVQKAISSFPRQALHATRLTIPHPRTGEVMTFEAPLPEDMQELLRALR
jgi:23S rRNA pseudouridine1911/1915/1917 synthase